MIINQDGGPVVPNKKIAVFSLHKDFDMKKLDVFLKPLNHDYKRDWFTQIFYHCLPLSIGNMQGFIVSLPYEIKVIWNGDLTKDSIIIEYGKEFKKYENDFPVAVRSDFGHGIFTIYIPVTLKTPPGINLMTIAPPNFPLPGLSPMTGVVESDNIRFSFTFNIKIDLINTPITIPANTPLIGLLPIPRYFCDSFTLIDAHDIFDNETIKEEESTVLLNVYIRKTSINKTKKHDRLYFRGVDSKKNKFKDHQLPKKRKT
jgi:hypothetical protein